MKTLIILLSALCLSLQAQPYSIDWYKIAGGGGTSTNGPFAITGTIGQPDASGALTGGGFSVTGGFWSLISVVPTAGLPNLTITHTNNQVIVSWPATVPCTLQQNNTLTGGSWNTSGYPVTTTNGASSITIPAPAGTLFFRLTNP